MSTEDIFAAAVTCVVGALSLGAIIWLIVSKPSDDPYDPDDDDTWGV